VKHLKTVLKVAVMLPITVPKAFLYDPLRFIWNLLTLPLFLALVPVAAVVSLRTRCDVFPKAYQWTHAILAFGHRWRPDHWITEWDTCWCGATRIAPNVERHFGVARGNLARAPGPIAQYLAANFFGGHPSLFTLKAFASHPEQEMEIPHLNDCVLCQAVVEHFKAGKNL